MVTVIAIVALVIFAAGAAVGGVGLVSWGIRREEKNFSLTRQAPGRASLGARLVTGLYVRQQTDIEPSRADWTDIAA